MAQETKVEETRCSLQTFERNRYFYGKPMTVSDFEAEQRYLIGKQRYVNRLVHGAGVLCGLQVTAATAFSAESPTVELAEGAALDCCGNLIIVSRSGTAAVKGDFDPDGSNYLYIRYTECSKQPVMLAANGSSCEEVCCYNRIQETFEIVASRTAPDGGEGMPAAAKTVLPKAKTKAKAAAAEPLPDPETVCRDLTEAYYQEHLKTCPGCDDPLVFLAVLDGETGAVDEAETAMYRSVVFNNPMLHELLCDHVTDFNNPHHTNAEQVRALQSVNGVGNNSTRPFVANIDLQSSDATLGITPDINASKIDLVLAANSVKTSHLNADVIENLVKSNKTISVTTNAAAKTITLSTKPAGSVTSVGAGKVVGQSEKFAPEDHAHDLSANVVGRKHLDTDLYTNLVQGGGIVKVEGQAAAQTIKVSAAVSINGRTPDVRGDFLLTPGDNITIHKGVSDNELVISAEGKTTEIATGFFIFEDVLPQERRLSTLIAHRLEADLVAVVVALEEAEDLSDRTGARLATTNAAAKFGDLTAFNPEAPSLMAEVDYNQRTIQLGLKDNRFRQESRLNSDVKLTDAGGLTLAREGDPAPPKDTSDTGATSGTLAATGTGDGIIIDPNSRTYQVRWWAIPASTT